MNHKTFIHDNHERDYGCPESPETYKRNAKTINLAIQGGGAHGAYAWGYWGGLLGGYWIGGYWGKKLGVGPR